jgi:hypothetical protein
VNKERRIFGTELAQVHNLFPQLVKNARRIAPLSSNIRPAPENRGGVIPQNTIHRSGSLDYRVQADNKKWSTSGHVL